MLNWYKLWFLFVVALMFTFLPGLLPTFEYRGQFYGGGPVREYFLNLFLQAVPAENSHQVASWFMGAGLGEELVWWFLVALNLYVFLVVPLVFTAGSVMIYINNWFTKGDFGKSMEQLNR